MTRLNQQAYKILFEEIQRCATNDAIGETERKIVYKRLERMQRERGTPANYDELRDVIIDIYPQFDPKVLKKAAKVNQPPSPLWIIFGVLQFGLLTFAGLAGLIWLANLPYPMIRKPVAEKAPLLLLPSYISMDNSYRGAIRDLEQAEQLLGNTTSTKDIELGTEKVKSAQRHLDNLPVWFLGYYPQMYCRFFSCTWQFTFDEFENARRRVAKLEAIAFQGKNALEPLAEAEKNLIAAKQKYRQAKTIPEKEEAIAAWQAAIYLFDEIPLETLAGNNAQIKVKGYKHEFVNTQIGTYIAAAQEFDFQAEKIKSTQAQTATSLWEQAISRLNQIPQENPRYLEAQRLIANYQVKLEKSATQKSSSTYIEAAKKIAFQAATHSQNPPHSAEKWSQIASLWERSINILEKIGVEEAGYVEAQKYLADYQTNLGVIQTRIKMEIEAKRILDDANTKIQHLLANPPDSHQQFKNELNSLIALLQTIKSGTTAYGEAQQLITYAKKRVK